MKIYFLGKHAYTQTCTHADIDTDTYRAYTLRMLRQMAFSHVKGHVTWHKCGHFSFCGRKGVISIKHHLLQVEEPPFTVEEFMLDHINVLIIQPADSWAACLRMEDTFCAAFDLKICLSF